MKGRLPTMVPACLRALTVLIFLQAAPALAQGGPEVSGGQRLSDALQALQARGLRLVFSSEIVTPEMRVQTEPKAVAPRAILDELLQPHGLEAVNGPSGVIQIVRAKAAKSRLRRPIPAPPTGTIRGRVLGSATGSPLEGGVVRLLGDDERSATTDRDGWFHLTDVPVGTRSLRVSMEGYAPETQDVRVDSGATGAVVVKLTRTTVTYRERVTVMPDQAEWLQPRGGAQFDLGRREIDSLAGISTADSSRLVHGLPRVAAPDDFRSEFSVRGSPYRHVGIVVDGVSTPWLRHTAYGRGEMGSLAMLGTDVLEDATLRAGAYPQRYGNVLGAQLGLTLREGSRDKARLRGTFGGLNAGVRAEGPLGRSGRGSWLAAGRQSYLNWPIRPRGELSGTVFGTTDGLAKLVYDVSPTQQASLVVLGGRSHIDERDDRAPHELGTGSNRTGLLNVGWRSTLGPGLMVNQRAYLVDHRFLNHTQAGVAASRGRNRELSYRADVLKDTTVGLLEIGGQVQRLESVYRASPTWLRSAYANFTWAPVPRVGVAPGIRLTDATLGHRPAISPWILGEWAVAPGWTVNAGVGVAHQFSDVEAPAGAPGPPRLRPERALHFDLGVEQRLGRWTRWQATYFARDERDIVTEPAEHPRVAGRVLFEPAAYGLPEDGLSGSARGVELLVESRRPTGLSGWAAYSFGTARYTDGARGETFWGDFDQRHAVKLAATYRPSEQASVGVGFHGASNFPVSGYFERRNGGLFVGARRNDVRLPAYARLDVRATRSLTYGGVRITLFAEVLNVLNRTNLAVADGFIRQETGEAVGFTDALLPRLPTVGFAIEF